MPNRRSARLWCAVWMVSGRRPERIGRSAQGGRGGAANLGDPLSGPAIGPTEHRAQFDAGKRPLFDQALPIGGSGLFAPVTDRGAGRVGG
ncbi:hypothetical protein GCM10009539_59910 [Cryptosporangium japonicum]|uniref:Uncharacterized protein n=1 Tax=Cryptosporangium japonicum TaxID=80872 RepID=A0ABP3EMN0_9ACTN